MGHLILRDQFKAHLIQLVAAQIRILDWAWLAQMAEFDPRYLHLIPARF
ncbi:hypothetical protein ACRBEV_11145 [Methylobacterium phyllosphaerae]